MAGWDFAIICALFYSIVTIAIYRDNRQYRASLDVARQAQDTGQLAKARCRWQVALDSRWRNVHNT